MTLEDFLRLKVGDEVAVCNVGYYYRRWMPYKVIKLNKASARVRCLSSGLEKTVRFNGSKEWLSLISEEMKASLEMERRRDKAKHFLSSLLNAPALGEELLLRVESIMKPRRKFKLIGDDDGHTWAVPVEIEEMFVKNLQLYASDGGVDPDTLALRVEGNWTFELPEVS